MFDIHLVLVIFLYGSNRIMMISVIILSANSPLLFHSLFFLHYFIIIIYLHQSLVIYVSFLLLLLKHEIVCYSNDNNDVLMKSPVFCDQSWFRPKKMNFNLVLSDCIGLSRFLYEQTKGTFKSFARVRFLNEVSNNRQCFYVDKS